MSFSPCHARPPWPVHVPPASRVFTCAVPVWLQGWDWASVLPSVKWSVWPLLRALTSQRWVGSWGAQSKPPTARPPPRAWTPSPRKLCASRGWGLGSCSPRSVWEALAVFKLWRRLGGAGRGGDSCGRAPFPSSPRPRCGASGQAGPSTLWAPQARHAAGAPGSRPRWETEAHRDLGDLSWAPSKGSARGGIRTWDSLAPGR